MSIWKKLGIILGGTVVGFGLSMLVGNEEKPDEEVDDIGEADEGEETEEES